MTEDAEVPATRTAASGAGDDRSAEVAAAAAAATSGATVLVVGANIIRKSKPSKIAAPRSRQEATPGWRTAASEGN